MDPFTVIVLLAAQLMFSGGLLYLISRRLPPRSGIGTWAAGVGLFGLAYAARLALGLYHHSPWVVPLDGLMVWCALLHYQGARQYMAVRPLSRHSLLWAVAGFGVLQTLVVVWAGPQGRHGLLNLVLGGVYGLLAGLCWRQRKSPGHEQRPPISLLMGILGGLSVLTLARSVTVLVQGPVALYEGWLAKIFYPYAAMAAFLLVLIQIWLVFVKLNTELSELATRDALTRVFNRSGLQQLLDRHFGARQRPPVRLLALDVDHFKRVNDQHGHAAGDEVLRAVAAYLSTAVRVGDCVARMGGEEFLVVALDLGEPEALALAERLRAGVAELRTGPLALAVTVSLGVSPAVAEREAVTAALMSADRALYRAKQAGRNTVRLADEPSPAAVLMEADAVAVPGGAGAGWKAA